MKAKHVLWGCIGIIGFLAVMAISFYFWAKYSVDFNDYPAILEEVSDTGHVKLDTYNGEVHGKLSEVEWNDDPHFLKRARKVIQKAQRDSVNYTVKEDGTIVVWYQGEGKENNLNNELKRLAAASGSK